MNSKILPVLISSYILIGVIGRIESIPTGKIQGGTAARAREFPYTVSIRTTDLDNLGHFCGGAILTPNLIITAAACTDPISPNISEIVAGTLYRNEPYPGQQSRLPARLVPHPGYVFPPYDDVALIFLDSPLEFSENVSAIALPQSRQETYPLPVVINGWGAEQYGQNLSDILMRITVDTYSDDYCQTFMGQDVPETLLCGGVDEGGISACIGDAGGPVTTTTSEVYLAGVMSHFGCTEPNCCGFPGPMDHNPEIAFYLDWIEENNKKYGGGFPLRYASRILDTFSSP